MKFNQNQVGLSVGIIFGLSHLLWVIVVALGWGQALGDWSWNLHFVAKTYQVMPFDLVKGLLGVVLAFVTGYIAGWLFAWIWNWIGKMAK